MTGVILKLLDVQLKSIILPPPWFCLFKTVITLVWWSAVRGPGPFVQGEVTLGPFYSPDTRTDFDVGEAESCSPVAIITWLLPEWTVNWFHVLFSDPSFGTTSSSLLSPPPPWSILSGSGLSALLHYCLPHPPWSILSGSGLSAPHLRCDILQSTLALLYI